MIIRHYYRNRFLAKIMLLLFFIGYSIPAGLGQSKSELQDSISNSRRNAIVRAVERASPAVVNISTTRIERVSVRPPFFDDWWTPFFDTPLRIPQRRELHGLGSGVIFDRKGYVLTNQHVIEGAQVTKVILSDGREFDAKIIGEDFLSDLAVLAIDASNLTEIELGNSDDLLIGEWAIAIGHPFAATIGNPKPTVTIGVVSATDRALKTDERLYRNLIQTDASINPGNSGGPLVNLYGQLIGINTAIYSTSGGSQGIGFAMPVNTAKKVADQLIPYGAVVPPNIGLDVQDLTPELADSLNLKGNVGVLVAAVERGSPAAEAGIQRRDVIEAIDQQPMTSSEAFSAVTRLLHENQIVTFQVLSDGKRKNLRLKIRELQWTFMMQGWGITVDQLDRKAAEQYDQRGVLVSKIDRNSTLAQLGLKRGDLIYQINDLKIKSLGDFKRITSQLQRNQVMTLYFERNHKLMRFTNLLIQ